MAVDERERIALQKDLERTLGVNSAVTMMTLLPPAGWTDVVRSADLQASEQRLGARIDGSAQRLDSRIDGLEQRLDARIDGLEQHMDDRFALADSALQGVKHELLAAFRGELVAAVTTQTRTILWALLGAFVGVAGLALALARLS